MPIKINILKISNFLTGFLFLKTFIESLLTIENLAHFNQAKLPLLLGVVICGGISSVLVAFSLRLQITALLLAASVWLFGFLCPMTRTIGHGYLIYALLILSTVNDEDLSRGRFAEGAINFLWFGLGLSYLGAALDKWNHIFWHSGQGLEMIFKFSPALRENIVTAMLVGAPGMLQVLTFAVIAIEGLAFLLYIKASWRPLGWILITVLHLGIITCLKLDDLTICLLLSQSYLLADSKLWMTFAGSRAKIKE